MAKNPLFQVSSDMPKLQFGGMLLKASSYLEIAKTLKLEIDSLNDNDTVLKESIKLEHLNADHMFYCSITYLYYKS